MSLSISRVLLLTVIHLAYPFLDKSRNQPSPQAMRITFWGILDLAPNRVYTILLFNKNEGSLTPLFHPYLIN